ncbi:MAG: DUF1732 domain-containing protein [Candidatus Cloacimonetes bacterium]|nr:DUF1732 domain-containing protein [Candidatus Cloacimonadota bacterium]
MKSMTGYGLAKAHDNDIDLEFELKSINGRYLDLRLYLPREIGFFEYTLRQKLAATLSRGTVEVRASFTDHREPRIRLNQAKLEKYHAIVREAAEALSISGAVSLEFLLNEPGIIESVNNLDEDSVLNRMLNQTLDQALANLVRSLSAEADNIRQVLSASCARMVEVLAVIEVEIKPYKEELFAGMKTRTAELLNSFGNDNIEQRLFQELAIYIDKYDIHEELSRLRSHIQTLLNNLDKTEDNGKSLNFILQEMQREANTLGSKFSTAKTFEHILLLKEEVEKCREIVQNVA